MTARCPFCGAKWSFDPEDYVVYIPEGERAEIKCMFCDNVIEYVITHEWSVKCRTKMCSGYERAIVQTDRKLRDVSETIDRILHDDEVNVKDILKLKESIEHARERLVWLDSS